MAAPKLTEEQRTVVIGWLAAEYAEPAIRTFLAAREWPVINSSSLQYYRDRYRPEIEAARTQRRAAALTTGLALKDERVERLKQHADALEELKWVPDKKGKLGNEKAWRETLDDIAKELGHRRSGVDVNVGRLSDEALIKRTARLLGGDGSPWADPPDPEAGEDDEGPNPVLPPYPDDAAGGIP